MADFLQLRAPKLLLRTLTHSISATDLPGPEDDWKLRARNVMTGVRATCTLVEMCFLSSGYDREIIKLDETQRMIAAWLQYGVARAMELWG